MPKLNKKIFLPLFLCLIIFSASSSSAAPIKILFYYPGGQGSQEAAQPILDSFAEALKKSSGGKIEAQIFYFSDPQEGAGFLQAQKPQAGILGLDTFLKQGQAWGAQVIAKTLQLPSGDGTDQYFLLGKSGVPLPGSGALQVSSPRPLDPGFVAEKLFPQMKDLRIEVKPTPNTVGELRAIGSGTKTGWVLLDQFEYGNIAKLKTPWAAALSVAAQSPKISSAPFVIFTPNAAPDLGSDLAKALEKMGADSANKETLGNLRIRGFRAASSL